MNWGCPPKLQASCDVLMDVCTERWALNPTPWRSFEIEGSVYSSIPGVSQTNLESLVDRKLQEQDSKLDSKFEHFVDFILTEMCSWSQKALRPPWVSLVILKLLLMCLTNLFQLPGWHPYSRTLRSYRSPLGKPHCSAAVRPEVDPWGRVLPVPLACPPNITNNTLVISHLC